MEICGAGLGYAQDKLFSSERTSAWTDCLGSGLMRLQVGCVCGDEAREGESGCVPDNTCFDLGRP